MTDPTQIPVIIDPNIPLTRTVRDDDGNETTEPVLCWQIDGQLVVHPDRYEQYFKPLERKP
jgi:hypothetical protein